MRLLRAIPFWTSTLVVVGCGRPAEDASDVCPENREIVCATGACCDIDENRGCRVCQCCPMGGSAKNCGLSPRLCEELSERRKDRHRATLPPVNEGDGRR